jgi:hypothetical protein
MFLAHQATDLAWGKISAWQLCCSAEKGLKCCAAAFILIAYAAMLHDGAMRRKPMAKAATPDFTKYMSDMMASFPMDTTALTDAFKTQAAMGEKLSKVVLEAAEKSTEISTGWTKDTIAKMGDVATVKVEPTDYSKAMTDFASAQSEMAAETMAAFAEVAKKVQMETVELMMAAGKEASEEATAAVKKATADVTTAAKKATASAK